MYQRLPNCRDDHEIADSAWAGGYEDGEPKHWEQQKREALQAYGEWIPVRGFDHANVTMDYCARSLQFGNLVTLVRRRKKKRGCIKDARCFVWVDAMHATTKLCLRNQSHPKGGQNL